jgi:hypothetical protein
VLLRFAVENFRSIRDRQELSFLATPLNERSGIEVDVRPNATASVLPVIGVYGANASGKSNILNALAEMAQRAVTPPRSEHVPRPDPFLIDPNGPRTPTLFEIEFLIEGVRYAYGLTEGSDGVSSEWLHAFPLGRRQVWFERNASASDPFRFPGDYLRGSKALLADLVRPDAPFLSIGTSLNHPQLSPVTHWLNGIKSIRSATRFWGSERGLSRFFESQYAELANELIRRADLGIIGAEHVEPTGLGDSGRRSARYELQFRHAGKESSVLLPLRSESDGTLSWARTLQVLLPTLATGSVAVIDELDASLHPELAAEVIRIFQDPEVNRRRAQLLFACHDVTMLGANFGTPLLDRDQVWFAEKDQTGATELYPLAELAPRKGENLERGYLAGRYGATPGFSPGELGRVLRTLTSDENT